MSNLIIQFDPYLVHQFSREDETDNTLLLNGQNLYKVDYVPWCSLPDLLFDSVTNQIIGLSFLIVEKQCDLVEGLFKDALCATICIVNSDDGSCQLYEGAGTGKRLELYFRMHTDNIECNVASLYDGYWLYPKKSLLSPDNIIDVHAKPYGYFLPSIEEVAEEQGLNW